MTMHEDSAFLDAERLRDALEREVDRPGLEGPSLEAVLHSAAGRVRRRRVTVGATVAVAAVAVGTSVAVSRGVVGGPGPNRSDPRAVAAAGTTSRAAAAATTAAAAGTLAAATMTAPTQSTATGRLPADVVLASGTVDGHSWRLALHYDQPVTAAWGTVGGPTPNPDSNRQVCADYSVFVDDTWTNAGGGGEACVVDGKAQPSAPELTAPGFSSIGILDPQHGYHGGVVVGSVAGGTASVVAQCSSGKKYDATPFQPVPGSSFYYTFVFPTGSSCGTGTLSFYDAAHKRVAFLGDVGLGSTK
jgi:hypothetical protein